MIERWKWPESWPKGRRPARSSVAGWTTTLAVCCLTLVLFSESAAQSADPVGQAALDARGGALWAGAGAALPRGGTANRYAPGPAAALALEFELNRRFAVRLDAEWSTVAGRLPGYPADLRTHGASLNGLLRFSEGPVVPYALAGLGAYRLQRVDDEPSVYGTTAAVQAGFGIDARIWSAFEPFLEARATVHITDYASDEFTASVLVPIVGGIRIPLRKWIGGRHSTGRDMNLLKSVVGSIVIGVLDCGSPEAEQPERYAMSDVYHVLNDQGRRTGELTADSMVVSDDGNVASHGAFR